MEYASFRVGVADSKNRSAFFPITVFNRQREAVAQYVTKGVQVLVEGRVEVSQTGRASVIADRVVFGASPDPAREKARAKAERIRKEAEKEMQSEQEKRARKKV